MKKTKRLQRGILSFSLVVVSVLLWLFFVRFYPLIVEEITLIQLPHIDPTIFLIAAGSILGGLFISWGMRNKLWKGFPYALRHYSITKRLRGQIKKARFDDQDELNNQLVKLPKIKVKFDDDRKRISGKVFIESSVKNDKKLENIRIDSALKGYVSERQFLSQNGKWYEYEIYAVGSLKSPVIKTKVAFIEWSNQTAGDYALRLDDRTTVPFHHVGISGMTGSGKSVLIQMLVEQVLSKKPKHELYIIDPKRTDVYQTGMQIVGKQYVADKSHAIDLIKQFHEQKKQRQKYLEDFFAKNRNKTYVEAGLPAHILLIDEFGSLRESWKTMPKKKGMKSTASYRKSHLKVDNSDVFFGLAPNK